MIVFMTRVSLKAALCDGSHADIVSAGAGVALKVGAEVVYVVKPAVRYVESVAGLEYDLECSEVFEVGEFEV